MSCIGLGQLVHKVSGPSTPSRALGRCRPRRDISGPRLFRGVSVSGPSSEELNLESQLLESWVTMGRHIVREHARGSPSCIPNVLTQVIFCSIRYANGPHLYVFCRDNRRLWVSIAAPHSKEPEIIADALSSFA